MQSVVWFAFRSNVALKRITDCTFDPFGFTKLNWLLPESGLSTSSRLVMDVLLFAVRDCGCTGNYLIGVALLSSCC